MVAIVFNTESRYVSFTENGTTSSYPLSRNLFYRNSYGTISFHIDNKTDYLFKERLSAISVDGTILADSNFKSLLKPLFLKSDE